MLLPHVYELLGQLEMAPGEMAERLLARVLQMPEMDGDQLVADMGRIAVGEADENELIADADADLTPNLFCWKRTCFVVFFLSFFNRC